MWSQWDNYRPNSSNHMRFDISKLKKKTVDSHRRIAARGNLQEMFGEKLNQLWEETDSNEKKEAL